MIFRAVAATMITILTVWLSATEQRLKRLEAKLEATQAKADALETLAIVHEGRLNAVSEDVDKLVENS